MRRLPAGLALLLLVLLAEAASACPKCYVPPPYTRAYCGSGLCGWDGCIVFGGPLDCHHLGERCSENDQYCRNGEPGPENQDWADCGTERPLAKEWTLVDVKVRHEKIRARG